MKKVLYLLTGVFFLIQCAPQPYSYEEGVSKDLAQVRANQIKNLSYQLDFIIPASLDSLCSGTVKIAFALTESEAPIVIDFRAPAKQIKKVTANTKRNTLYSIENGHIIIPTNQFNSSEIAITIDFESTNTALNRNKAYLYTLFVPDRASTAFPCFDQPDLKASYTLNLTVPKEWTAVSNSPLTKMEKSTTNDTYQFDKTAPLSTYLFSFVAGKFEVLSKQRDGQTIRIFHREEDKNLVSINQEKIFQLQFESLKWLEDYTNYAHPFAKLDMIAIPSFQYSGMEHPGAILYRSEKLFLSADASVRQQMDRANLISHESAHLWFGDLVTMEWFNEVWMKEVFANFLADKIVEEAYPAIDHELNFYLNHFEAAYSIDRTEGANPIQQPLDNLINAGSLYGPIIYHKSPIIMKQLEALVTPAKLQEGLQKYVAKYAFANASWSDLIDLLNNDFDGNLQNWSNTWVNLPGRPKVTIMPAYDADEKLTSLIVRNQAPYDTINIWQQQLSLHLIANEANYLRDFLLLDTLQAHTLENSRKKPQLIIPGAKGLAYAHFYLEEPFQERLFNQAHSLKAPLHRAIAYQVAWEHMLDGNTTPIYTAKNYFKALQVETNTQLREWLMDHLEKLFVEWIPNSQQPELANQFNQFLWQLLQNPRIKNKQAVFSTFMATATSTKDLKRLRQIFQDEERVPNLSIKSRDIVSLGLTLMLKDPDNYATTKKKVIDQISDDELTSKFLLLSKAVSPQKAIRDSLFFSFKDPANREKEPWVVEAIHYLHHPIHPQRGLSYIAPSLELLEEIQRTGDIFFPARWINATFWSHNEQEVVQIVIQFLKEHPNYPDHLRNKILQAVDNTKRKAKLQQSHKS